MSHTDNLNPLLAVYEPCVDFFHTVRVFERSDGIHKIHAMFAKVHGGFAIVPLVSHVKIVPDIGSDGKWATGLPGAGTSKRERLFWPSLSSRMGSSFSRVRIGTTWHPSHRLAATRSTC